MQVQIKRQLKIELDQADITTAVKQFLADAGHYISDEDLEKINYVKSPKDGLRAELSISDEVVADEPVQVTTEKKPSLEVSPTPTAEAVREEPVEVDGDIEQPGEVETSTVEDVMPSVAEIKTIVETQPAVELAVQSEEDESVVPSADEAPRKSLFL